MRRGKILINYFRSIWQCRYLLFNMFASAVVGGVIGGVVVIICGGIR